VAQFMAEARCCSPSRGVAPTIGSPNRAKIWPAAHVDTVSQELLNRAKALLDSSRQTARLARKRIDGSRALLSESGDAVVATASAITAARSALRGDQRR
jgi:hypothetical protein